MASTTVKYSKAEERLLKLIPKSPKRITSQELVKKYYAGTVELPFNAQKIVVGMVAGLVEKAKYNKEKFRVRKERPEGQKALEIWIE